MSDIERLNLLESRMGNIMKEKYFVYVNGLRGPMPQIWDEKEKTTEGKPVKILKDAIKLHIKDDRSLEQLTKDYPYEAS